MSTLQSSAESTDVKYIIHAELYRVNDGILEFLLVKRVPHDGDFWQPITGGLEKGEEVRACVLREIAEESGITEYLHVSDELHRTYYEHKGETGCDLVHAVHVPYDAEVTLNPLEHEAHEWLPLEAALERLYFDGNRESMRKVHTYILSRAVV